VAGVRVLRGTLAPLLGAVCEHNSEHIIRKRARNAFIFHQLKRRLGCLLNSESGVRFTPGALPYSPRNLAFIQHPERSKVVAILYNFTPF
jgi:hypothetical protein